MPPLQVQPLFSRFCALCAGSAGCCAGAFAENLSVLRAKRSWNCLRVAQNKSRHFCERSLATALSGSYSAHCCLGTSSKFLLYNFGRLGRRGEPCKSLNYKRFHLVGEHVLLLFSHRFRKGPVKEPARPAASSCCHRILIANDGTLNCRRRVAKEAEALPPPLAWEIRQAQ